MKNRKFLKVILLTLILIISFIIIQDTYSKYLTQTDNNSKLNISNWHILLNDKNIQNQADFTRDVSIEYEKSEHVTDGVIVPTSKGTFDVTLESTGTELPFQYELILSKPKPYTLTLKTETAGTESTPYLYNIDLLIQNTTEDLTSWTLEFVTPETLVAESCIFTDIPTFEINDNKIKLTSTDAFSKDEIKTLSMTLAFPKAVNINVSNVTLNGKNFDETTERLADFRITSYSLNGVEKVLSSATTSVIGVVMPADNITDEVINNFTFTVEWYDGRDNILDNFKDVAATKANIPPVLPVQIKVTQVITE